MSARHACCRMMAVTALAFPPLIIAAGCTSTPEPKEMARTTLQTAPADLQLLCANAVATRTGTASDRVLPVNSRQIDSRSFQVELDAAGTRHSCVIDNDGNVTSLS